MRNPESSANRGNIFQRRSRELILGATILTGGGITSGLVGGSLGHLLNSRDLISATDRMMAQSYTRNSHTMSVVESYQQKAASEGLNGIILLGLAAGAATATVKGAKRIAGS